MNKLLEMNLKDDVTEKCIAFDPLLKFWYDDFWVQKIPIGRTNTTNSRRVGQKSIGLTMEDVSI